jgi:hypothetical protein
MKESNSTSLVNQPLQSPLIPREENASSSSAPPMMDANNEKSAEFFDVNEEQKATTSLKIQNTNQD